MSRFASWLTSAASKLEADDTPEQDIARDKRNLQEAVEFTGLIMNDDLEGAWENLKKGDSVFHDTGAAVTVFFRAVLGFEKEVMTEASDRLAKVEAKAWTEIKRAQRRGAAGHRSSAVYPPGAEYELITAQSQLMSAVVGVLHESLVEGMKSFYKIRKAFIALDGILAAEEKFLRKHGGEKSASGTDSTGSDEDEFVDVKEQMSGTQTPITPPNTDTPDGNSTDTEGRSRPATPLQINSHHRDINYNFTDPVDIFIHSGANMCMGLIFLLLSLVPPAFSRILSVVGFRGDRARAVKMLWRSSAYNNVNGAVSALVLLTYYHEMLGIVDVLPHEQDFDDEAEAFGPPDEKCVELIKLMQSRYPDARLWRIESARTHAIERDIDTAIEVLKTGDASKMKQVDALNNFVLSVNGMMGQDWPLMRDSFLRCLEINEWSPALYYYMAGAASLELYRNAVHAGEESEARVQKEKTHKFMRKAPTVAGKKRLMTRQLPLETFIQRKVQKWEARAKELDLELADAIGASPALEMCFMWNGQKNMNDKYLQLGIDNLAWERGTAEREKLEKLKEDKDEMAVWAVCTASLLKGAKRYDEAREILQKHVICYEK